MTGPKLGLVRHTRVPEIRLCPVRSARPECPMHLRTWIERQLSKIHNEESDQVQGAGADTLEQLDSIKNRLESCTRGDHQCRFEVLQSIQCTCGPKMSMQEKEKL